MAFVHGKDTKVLLNAVDLSAFTNSTAFNRTADSHDTTTYGQTGHTFQGGLTNGTVTLTGSYDDAAAATPAVVLSGLLVAGTITTFLFQPKGLGAGKPQRSCSVQVTGYDETSPVADMITWSATLQISGAVNSTAQA